METTVVRDSSATKTILCGNSYDMVKLKDELAGYSIGLVKATEDTASDKTYIILKGMFMSLSNTQFTLAEIRNVIEEMKVAGCNKPFDMEEMKKGSEEAQMLKMMILMNVKGIATQAYHGMVFGYSNKVVNGFVYEALKTLGENVSEEKLLEILIQSRDVIKSAEKLLHMAELSYNETLKGAGKNAMSIKEVGVSPFFLGRDSNAIQKNRTYYKRCDKEVNKSAMINLYCVLADS